MGGIAVVSPFLRVLVHRLKSLTDDNHHTASNLSLRNVTLMDVTLMVVEGLEELAEMFDTAEEMATEEDIVQQLLEVVFEADDLIDEVQLESQLHLPRSGVSLCFNPFSKESKFAKALRHSLLSLPVGVATEFRVFGSRTSGKLASVSQGTKPHPYLGRSQIIGRERDGREIIDSILNAEADSVKLGAIVGMGGVGKTSVAQLIYNDPSVCSKFDIRLWVDVGKDGDMFDVVVQMSMQAMEEYDLRLDADFMNLEEMKRELFSELLSKKSFFLVVDDLWSLELLGSFFIELITFGSKDSAVIVTTRISYLVTHVSPDAFEYPLGPLSLQKSYQLFNEYAYASNGIETQPEFEAIAKQIVRQCNGLPILLKTVGTYFYNKDTLQQWAEVLQSHTLQGDDHYDFSRFLNFITDKLPSYLRLPFCTFSFQRNSSVEEIICLWMALGFFSSDDPNQQPEYIGRRYLTELAESALCPDVEYAPGGAVRAIKLHDFVYDMAEQKALEQGFSRGYDSSQKTRYFIGDEDSVPGIELLKKPHKAKKMRLFMLHARKQVSAQIVREILSCFKCLRVLGLGGCNIETLPDSIGQLKHLRYLDVGRNFRMRSLPDSICNLWHLQTLLLHGCDQLEALPAGIGSLQNLRYLTLTTLQESLPDAIGELNSLRTLGLASCPRLSSLPCSIKNLKNLHTLGIADCQEMDLAASSSAEGLRGMDGIDTLLIAGIPKFECLPTDMGTPSLVMKHLLVQSCEKLTETAWINQFRFLHSLTIERCPELSPLATDGASQFNSLVELVIRGCPSLGNTTWITRFVALRSLIIDGCRNVVALDAGFTELKSLERLEIRKCPHLSERCASPTGEDWPLIAHVQVIELDGKSLKS